MYAIIEDGGKQYKVAQGENVCIELKDLPEGESTIEFDRVLFYRDGEATLVGQPYLEGAKVIGKVNGRVDGPKLYPATFKRRKNCRRRIGHKQRYLEVAITEIVAS